MKLYKTYKIKPNQSKILQSNPNCPVCIQSSRHIPILLVNRSCNDCVLIKKKKKKNCVRSQGSISLQDQIGSTCHVDFDIKQTK